MTLSSPSLPPPAGPAPQPLAHPALDLALRVAGGLLAAFGGVVTAVVELLLASVRVYGQLIGVSVLIAIGANVALSWFAYVTVGRRWALALPAVPWFGLMTIASDRTDEGDQLLAANWVGVALILAGAMAFAVSGFRQILASPSRLDG